MQLRRPAIVSSVAVVVGLLTGCTGTAPAATQASQGPAAASVAAVASHAPLEARPVVHAATGGLAAQVLAGVAGVAAVADVANPAAVQVVRKGRLAGLTIVLDPGHNGGNAAQPHRLNALVPAGGFRKPCNTTGAETNGGYPEHAFTWDVVNRAAALLRAAGATVVLTRHSDTGFGPCVNKRAAIGNAAHADAVVAVHADGAASSAYGFHVIAPALAPDGGNRAILARSWNLAQDMHTAFHAVSGEASSTYISGGLTRRSDLAGLNLSRVPAIFIECANMRNAGDARRLTSPAWRQKAAAGIVAGLTAFLRR
jgi:N-acetylmuramoyl-L-alanine amidase